MDKQKQIEIGRKLAMILAGILAFLFIFEFFRDIPSKYNILAIVVVGIALAATAVLKKGQFLLHVVLFSFFWGGAFFATSVLWFAYKKVKVQVVGKTKLETVLEHRKAGKWTVPSIHPQNFLKSPLMVNGVPTLPMSSIADVFTTYCKESQNYFETTTDHYGFNNPPEAWNAPTVALVGASFVEGHCIESNHNISYTMNQAGIKTLNLGSGGDGPISALATIIEYASKVKPKKVLMFYAESDIQRRLYLSYIESGIPGELKSDIATKYLEQDGYTQNLMSRRDEVQKALADYVEKQIVDELAPPRFNLFKFAEGAVDFLFMKELRAEIAERIFSITGIDKTIAPEKRVKNLIGLGSKNDAVEQPDIKGLDTYSRILHKAHETVQSWGGELIWVYLPSYDMYSLGEHILYKLVLERAAQEKIQVIDFHKIFKDSGDPLQFFPNRAQGHYNEQGYKFIGDKLVEILKEKK